MKTRPKRRRKGCVCTVLDPEIGVSEKCSVLQSAEHVGVNHDEFTATKGLAHLAVEPEREAKRGNAL
jgi:hypothetical protein